MLFCPACCHISIGCIHSSGHYIDFMVMKFKSNYLGFGVCLVFLVLVLIICHKNTDKRVGYFSCKCDYVNRSISIFEAL